MAKFWEVYKDTRQPAQTAGNGSWWDNYKIENTTSPKKPATSTPSVVTIISAPASTPSQTNTSGGRSTTTQSAENIWDRHDGTLKINRTLPQTNGGSSMPNTTTNSVGHGGLGAPNEKSVTQSTSTKPLTGFAAGVQANNEGYRKLAEKPSFGNYVGRRFVGGAAESTEGTANAVGY